MSVLPFGFSCRGLFGRRRRRVAETAAQRVPLVRAEATKAIADIAIKKRPRVPMRFLQLGERSVAGAVDGFQQQARQDGDAVTHQLRLTQVDLRGLASPDDVQQAE